MKEFIPLLAGVSASLERPELTVGVREALAVGEMLADRFVEAARAKTLPPDALVCAVSLVGQQEIFVLSGFLRRITEALEGK